MSYSKTTIRKMSATTRKVAKLTRELQSIERRLTNLVPAIQSLEMDSRALAAMNKADEITVIKESSPTTQGELDTLFGEQRIQP